MEVTSLREAAISHHSPPPPVNQIPITAAMLAIRAVNRPPKVVNISFPSPGQEESITIRTAHQIRGETPQLRDFGINE